MKAILLIFKWQYWRMRIWLLKMRRNQLVRQNIALKERRLELQKGEITPFKAYPAVEMPELIDYAIWVDSRVVDWIVADRKLTVVDIAELALKTSVELRRSLEGRRVVRCDSISDGNIRLVTRAV